jgi:hypothetical protein
MTTRPSGAALDQLRRAISTIEHRDSPCGRARVGGARFSTGHAPLDAALGGGGLPGGALVEVRAEGGRDTVGSVAVALGLGAQVLRARPGLGVWIHGRRAGDDGLPHAPGLAAAGIAPGRMLVVGPLAPDLLLWAAEECLMAGGVGALVLQPDIAPGLVAARRLLLAGERCGAPVLVLGDPRLAPLAPARVRLEVRTLPSRAPPWWADRRPAGWMMPVGAPRWQLQVGRRGAGAPHEMEVEWDHGTHRFRDGSGLAHRTPGLVVGSGQHGRAA